MTIYQAINEAKKGVYMFKIGGEWCIATYDISSQCGREFGGFTYPAALGALHQERASYALQLIGVPARDCQEAEYAVTNGMDWREAVEFYAFRHRHQR